MPKINRGYRKNIFNISSRSRRRIMQLHNQDADFARNNLYQQSNVNSLPSSPSSSNELPRELPVSHIIINSARTDNIISSNSYSETNILNDLTTDSLNVLPAINTKSIENNYKNPNSIEIELLIVKLLNAI